MLLPLGVLGLPWCVLTIVYTVPLMPSPPSGLLCCLVQTEISLKRLHELANELTLLRQARHLDLLAESKKYPLT